MGRKFVSLAEYIVRNYLDHHVSRASAGLSYFFMLSIFPILICLYAMLGSLFPSVSELQRIFSGILPADTVDILLDYIGYVSENSTGKMVAVALVAMATSSAAAFRIIDKLMFELRGRRRNARFIAFVSSFLFSLVFLAALYFAAVIMATGGWFIRFVDENVSFINISNDWKWYRFLILFLLLFVIILGVYRICIPDRYNAVLVPGALAAALTMVGISILFSWFIGMSVKYPLVYGSLASVMIMLLWLYICSNLLFLGNILNIALEKNF